jgi:hypothetical protein
MGGGAGGYLVLEGAHIEVTGEVYANGGGGGAGAVSEAGTASQNGEDGSRSDSFPASGGTPQAGAGAGGGRDRGRTSKAGRTPHGDWRDRRWWRWQRRLLSGLHPTRLFAEPNAVARISAVPTQRNDHDALMTSAIQARPNNRNLRGALEQGHYRSSPERN